MEDERLDVKNIIEIQRIRRLLVKHQGDKKPDLLSMFEILCNLCNDKLNQFDEKNLLQLPLEDNTEPILSDHESDEESN